MPVKFSVSSVTDTSPPVVSGGSPTGTLAAGTSTTTMQVNTNEAATCRFSSTPGVTYSSMAFVFATTGGTTHSTTLSGLSNGSSYNYYVRCSDQSGNQDTADYAVSFSVGSGTTIQSSGLPLTLEAEAATLGGSALIESCRNCSGTRGVEQVGFYTGTPGTVMFQGVNVPSSGSYQLTVYYLNGSSTLTGLIKINGGADVSMSFANTGSWSAVSSASISVTLKSGANTIQIYNPNGPAPDLDRIVISQ